MLNIVVNGEVLATMDLTDTFRPKRRPGVSWKIINRMTAEIVDSHRG